MNSGSSSDDGRAMMMMKGAHRNQNKTAARVFLLLNTRRPTTLCARLC